MSSQLVTSALTWCKNPGHCRWLTFEADALFRFFESESIDPEGGFFALDVAGRAIRTEKARPLHAATRMAHCFAIGMSLGRPGAADFVDHAMNAIWTRHRDSQHGGYFWSFDANGPLERDKLAYGHAFVLLAASSAKSVGHPDADRLLADISEVLETKFWEPTHGASAEEFREDWSAFSDYRGQNSNMHLTEALMAAFEATGERSYLDKAENVASLILRRHAAEADWRIPEHFRADWSVDRDYRGSDMFRPYGYTPGHALEWARLALKLWALGSSSPSPRSRGEGRGQGPVEGHETLEFRAFANPESAPHPNPLPASGERGLATVGSHKLAWLPEAAKKLFAQAVGQGWDAAQGGLYYTTEYDGSPRVRDRLWWPICEGIGAAHFLGALDGDPLYETWYRRFWDFSARRLIDRRNGGWLAQLDGDTLAPVDRYFLGKPDIYHALQASLIPLYPADGSVVRGALGAPTSSP